MCEQSLSNLLCFFQRSASRLGGLHYYQMDYDDGAGLTQKFTSDFQSRAFHVPGTYRVRVLVNDLNDTLVVSALYVCVCGRGEGGRVCLCVCVCV